MLISTKGRYAMRVLVDMAEHQSEDYIPLKDIAGRQEISEKYLESIVKLLVRGGILSGLRGKGGGYRLSRAPDQLTAWEVLSLCEGTLAPVSCVSDDAEPCLRMASCRTRSLWQGLDKIIRDYLENITIADLTRRDEPGNDYII